MDSWIKTTIAPVPPNVRLRFNPCFNGFMDKDADHWQRNSGSGAVSTLALMDSWIKTTIDGGTFN